MPRPAYLLFPVMLLLLLLLSSCQRRSAPASNDLTSQILYTASGTYDFSADHRTREGQGIRQVVWQSKPPLAAQAVTVQYDSNQRTLAWKMQLQKSGVPLEKLTGPQARTVGTSRGPVQVIGTGRLKGTVVWQAGSTLTLETPGFIAQHDTDLVPALH